MISSELDARRRSFREFKPTAQLIDVWVVQVDKQESRRKEATPGLTAAECDELARLRRENKQLRLITCRATRYLR